MSKARKKHKYIARVLGKNNKYRYFSEAANAYRSGDTKKYKKLSKGISQREIDAKLIHDRKRARATGRTYAF